jgi:hypothetical protein
MEERRKCRSKGGKRKRKETEKKKKNWKVCGEKLQRKENIKCKKKKRKKEKGGFAGEADRTIDPDLLNV